MTALRLAVPIAALLSFSAFAQEPAYPHGAFREDCSLCHAPDSWKPAQVGPRFDHARYGMPLVGAHARAACSSCHLTLEFDRANPACVSCHQDIHRGELGTDCSRCHNARTFIDRAEMVRMHLGTRFPLLGSHVATDCEQCHQPVAQGHLQYVNLPVECVACHITEYRAATNPDHVAGGFPTQCEKCHDPLTWTHARFDHQATRFPLTGAHRATPCASCHGDGVYHGKSTLCVSCHQQDYNAATDPNHQAAGFPTSCESCHTTTTWVGAHFDHQATRFPLTGAHLTTPCASCHGDGVYHGKSTLCVSCHQQDYNATTDPNHQAAAFPTTCETCHTTTTWVGAHFDHQATQFPLTGAHLTTPCASCHGDGVYHGKSTLCVSCHQQDYNATTDPNHQAAGYPTTCQTCHTTVSWQGATDVNHDAAFFPIYSGAHRGQWSACTDCHTNRTNFAEFNCLLCHEHSNAAQVGNHHQGVNGYVYESHACYGCHPRGRAG